MLDREMVAIYLKNYTNNSVDKMHIFFNVKADGAYLQQPLSFSRFTLSVLQFEDMRYSMCILI